MVAGNRCPRNRTKARQNQSPRPISLPYRNKTRPFPARRPLPLPASGTHGARVARPCSEPQPCAPDPDPGPSVTAPEGTAFPGRVRARTGPATASWRAPARRLSLPRQGGRPMPPATAVAAITNPCLARGILKSARHNPISFLSSSTGRLSVSPPSHRRSRAAGVGVPSRRPAPNADMRPVSAPRRPGVLLSAPSAVSWQRTPEICGCRSRRDTTGHATRRGLGGPALAASGSVG